MLMCGGIIVWGYFLKLFQKPLITPAVLGLLTPLAGSDDLAFYLLDRTAVGVGVDFKF